MASDRSNATNLPHTKEVFEMMAKEAVRQPLQKGHFPEFKVVKNWLVEVGIESKVFEFERLEDISGEVAAFKAELVKKTLSLKDKTGLEEVQAYLGQDDQMEEVEVAIVFGGRTLMRADKGAELYLHGWTKKLLMTGRSPNYTSFFDQPEAVVFKHRAISLGVPEADIWVEDQAINIPDNVKRSLNFLDEIPYRYTKVASVISWYAQRRAWATLSKFVKAGVKIIRVNAELPKDSNNRLDVWYNNPEGIEIIFNEFVKMKMQALSDSA